MPSDTSAARTVSRFAPGLAWVLLCLLMVVLCLAGGASRADVLGQVVVRGAAFVAILGMVVFGNRPAFGPERPVLYVLLAALALTLLQLVPLPPAIWQSLPGRALFAEAAAASGEGQPWRPWSIVPGATVNAAASLVVPLTVLLLVAALSPRERGWLPGLLLITIGAATLLGLLQVSGAGFGNALVNQVPGMVSGPFANRNHFALMLALGCLLVPVWVFLEDRRARWRGPVGVGLVLLFLLLILATGSRVGLGLGVLATAIGLTLVHRGLGRELRRYPRWVVPAAVAGFVAVLAGLVAISFASDRAAAISRALTLEQGADMRVQGLPIVLDMTRTYFPWGAGFGSFDQNYRIFEPFAQLDLTYFNHAHNDLLEVVLDGGLPAAALLLGALGWWGLASVRVWRAPADPRSALGKLGSAMVLFILIASGFDYPARTPFVMALTVIAACWLSRATARGSALPVHGHHL